MQELAVYTHMREREREREREQIDTSLHLDKKKNDKTQICKIRNNYTKIIPNRIAKFQCVNEFEK
jgi:hypothetical protein